MGNRVVNAVDMAGAVVAADNKTPISNAFANAVVSLFSSVSKAGSIPG